VQGIAYVRELPVGQRPDVFWASAPDAFEVLAGQKLLENVADLVNKAAPAKVGAYPINDPQGQYLGQALAGYGLMWNTRYMAANKLPAPKQWADLAKPVYFGHVAMSSPSRSGTTHLTVETMLQGEGWDKGWSQLLQIAGNSAAITERSFGVPDGVNNGQFGIGLVIDFFGLAGKYSGFPVEFVYPDVTAVVPANIALVAGSKNPAEAKKFIRYTVSTEGQQLLFDPKISRLPILPLDQLKAPGRLPQCLRDRQARQGAVQQRFVRDALQRGVGDVRPDHHLPPEGTAGRHQGHPRGRRRRWPPSPTPQRRRLLKQARDLAFRRWSARRWPATRTSWRCSRQQEGRGGEQAGHRPGRPLEQPCARPTTSAPRRWPSRPWLQVAEPP
jgi:ABC-type Fe3+ transport system substrate-binding protein